MTHRTHLLSVLAITATLTLLSACGGGAGSSSPPALAPDSPLLFPQKATAKAPDIYKVRLTTSKGDVVIEVHRAWAPNGADRFYNLVQIGYYNGAPIFRVVEGFMAQFGVNANPEVNAKWLTARIPDDPPSGQSNTRGMVTFATSGADSRTTQVFINFADNGRNLDGKGFTPFGKVVAGMEVVDGFYNGYGDGPPYGTGPDQGRLQNEGSAYTKASYPMMDYITGAKIE